MTCVPSQTQPQNRLFDPGTLRNQSELEPTDDITRSTTPHERQLVLVLAMIVAFVAASATFPFVDHSLWLEGERLEASGALADASDASSDDVLLLRVSVAPRDAAHLAPGLTAYVYRKGVADSFTQGSIEYADHSPSAEAMGMHTIALRVPRDPSDPLGVARESSSDHGSYRLRIPVGIQTPFETLVGFLRWGGTEGGAPQAVGAPQAARTGVQRSAEPDPALGRARRAVI